MAGGGPRLLAVSEKEKVVPQVTGARGALLNINARSASQVRAVLAVAVSLPSLQSLSLAVTLAVRVIGFAGHEQVPGAWTLISRGTEDVPAGKLGRLQP